MNWYDDIEPEIRDLVRLLRNNGFNTIDSCGHKMYVTMEALRDSEITRLYNLLIENGYERFVIAFRWESYPISHKFMTMELITEKDLK